MSAGNYNDWYQFRLRLDQTNKIKVEEIYNKYDAASITYTNAGEESIYEPLPGETPYWEDSFITGLFELHTDFDALKKDILDKLNISELPPHSIKKLTGRAWEREWMKDFKPMCFGRKLWIYPENFRSSVKDKVIVYLDPGLAFGTGTHPTTKLCLEWLDSLDLRNKHILDYGCGSGILGISALKLGARKVTAIDIDPQAIEATKQNALKNNVEVSMVVKNNISKSKDKFDIIIANILAEPLVALAPFLIDKLDKNGIIGLSGILKDQVDYVKESYADFISINSPEYYEEWSFLNGSFNK